MTAALLASAEDRSTRAVLRHNLDAEAGILGGILLDNSVMERLDGLAVEDFWDDKHKVVFAAMRNLAAACRPIDVQTIEVQIAASGKLDAIGGPGFLRELVLRVPTPDNVAAYSDDVKRLARNRAAEVMLASALHRIRSGDIEPEDVVTETAGELARFAEDLRSDARGSLEYGRAFREFVGTDEPDENPADVFDAHGLIVTGEPSLLVGDPKVGKTLLLTDLLLHMAAGRREWCGVSIYRRPRVLLFLREDSERTTIRRIWQLARGAGIEHWELADHLVIDGTSPLYFDDAKLTTKLERQLARFDICAIDSLSTIHNADENSAERMAPIMNRWRDLSLRTRTAIKLVHHFRKRGNDAKGAATGGPVLQRARGSSIIGATTRHAVGVDRGPDEHQLVISVESNHEVDFPPFVIQRSFGTDDRGRKYIRHRRVGSLVDAREAKVDAMVDPVVLDVIRRAGPGGIGKRDLRTAVRKRLQDQRGKGVRNAKVDESAERLGATGQIARVGESWRAP